MTTAKQKQKKQAPVITKRKQHELTYVLNQLDSLSNVLSYGFSDGNWTIASRILYNLQGHLLQSDRDYLSIIWRDAFSDFNQVKIISDIESLKTRISSVG